MTSGIPIGRKTSPALALALALGLVACHAGSLRALDLAQLREWQAARQLAASGNVGGAQARWNALLADEPEAWTVVLARPCGGDLVIALAARGDLAPIWIAGSVDDCHGLLWGNFATEAEALEAAARIPVRYLEGDPQIVRLVVPLEDMNVRAPSLSSPTPRPRTAPGVVESVGSPTDDAGAGRTTIKVPVPAPDPTLSASALFARGNEAYARGDHAGAVASYEASLGKDPANPRTLNNLGTALLVSYEPARAERAFRDAVALDPTYARAWLNLGTALYAQNRPEEAKPMLEKAVALDPGSLDARSNLAALLVEMRRWDEARSVLKAGLVEFPGEAQLQRQLEQVEEQLAIRKDAEPTRSTAGLPLPGFSVDALGPCASDVSRSRRIAHASRLFDEGRSAFARSRFGDAEAAFEKALECDPTSPAILNHLGAARLAAGRAGSAAGAFALALEHDPTFLEASVNLALATFELGRCTDAVEQLRALADRQASSGEAAFQYGRMLYRCGRSAEAAAALERASLLLPADQRPAHLLDRLRSEEVRVP